MHRTALIAAVLVTTTGCSEPPPTPEAAAALWQLHFGAVVQLAAASGLEAGEVGDVACPGGGWMLDATGPQSSGTRVGLVDCSFDGRTFLDGEVMWATWSDGQELFGTFRVTGDLQGVCDVSLWSEGRELVGTWCGHDLQALLARR